MPSPEAQAALKQWIYSLEYQLGALETEFVALSRTSDTAHLGSHCGRFNAALRQMRKLLAKALDKDADANR